MVPTYDSVHDFLCEGLETLQCSICFDNKPPDACCRDDEDLVRINACSDYFHRVCLRIWVEDKAKNTCPYCRKTLYIIEDATDELFEAAHDIYHLIQNVLNRLEGFTYGDLEGVREYLHSETLNAIRMLDGLIRDEYDEMNDLADLLQQNATNSSESED
ncbi:hypothetical protein K491DRAFT_428934 [Lophiostoma macrostomum CBS 122681]|uniref:Anaphase-promoting complex subunit 11 n=1 Tax=Lophiostoma macrostomum CBS 122681 TaxID=1314788 RepID=A0A6A6T6S9_9PLEO|nr:hypothetical protein K491DRAFT_428934 [Lophiostoma macrostomum CBS 122681]